MGTILILGGTSWLGGEIAKAAFARGHHVTCLARGESGDVPAGAKLVSADRNDADAYRAVRDTRWDHVFGVSWQPAFVRGAVKALGQVSSHWTYVSSVSVYADQSVGGDEDAPLLPPLGVDRADPEIYGEAKVACEQIVRKLSHPLIVRPGLLGGPGDRSDRLGYWVSRFALAGNGPVLVPDALDQPVQVLDARDLAVWLVESAAANRTGTFNLVGAQLTLGQVLDASAAVAGFTGAMVRADPDWLTAQGVEPWAGSRSLPLWVPGHDGMGSRRTRTGDLGLRRRPLVRSLEDTFSWEKSKGLDRDRKAGLGRADELELIDRLRHGPRS